MIGGCFTSSCWVTILIIDVGTQDLLLLLLLLVIEVFIWEASLFGFKSYFLLRKWNFFFYDWLFYLFSCFTFEWVFAEYHCIHQDAQWPNIDLGITLSVSLQKLGWHILDAAYIVSLSNCTTIRAENSEISYFDMNFWRCSLCSRELIYFF